MGKFQMGNPKFQSCNHYSPLKLIPFLCYRGIRQIPNTNYSLLTTHYFSCCAFRSCLNNVKPCLTNENVFTLALPPILSLK